MISNLILMVKSGRCKILDYIIISKSLQGRTFSPVIVTEKSPHIRSVKTDWYAKLNLCYVHPFLKNNTD